MRHARKHPCLCAMCVMVCAMPCGNKLLIRKACALCAASASMCVGAGVRMCVRMRACVYAVMHGAHNAHSAHTLHIKHLRHFHAAQVAAHIPHNLFFKGEEMGEVKKVIACTPENADQMREVIRQWPALHGLVTGLQQQGLFPGLRGLQITLTGPQEVVDKGLDALTGENGLLARSASAQGAGEGVCN